MADTKFRLSKLWFSVTILLLLALIPVYGALGGEPYYVTLFSRIMIYALAALGLNFVLGFAGLASLGHAFYLGIGAYGVGILQYYGITNGWLQLGFALVIGLLFSTMVGAIVVRLSGMTFIMITLAFAQMGYFLAVTLKQYGGEDGRAIDVRSTMGLFDLSSDTVLYYLIFGCLVAVLWLIATLVDSRFGMVLRGCKSNERRMLALGYSTYRYKLTGYVISALICVVSGFLLANLTKYSSPSYMQWTVSAELIIMVVLGGMSTVFGPVLGALTFLLLEEWLANFHLSVFPELGKLVNEHWLAVIGAFVIVVVLTTKHGIYGYVINRGRE